MRIAVVGAGVVGGILGGSLLRRGEEVVLVDPSPSRRAGLKASGVRVVDPKGCLGGGFSVPVRELRAAFSELEGEPPEVVFVCSKTSALEAVAADLARVCSAETTVVSFQNGLDPEATLARRLGRDDVLRVVVNFAGRLLEDGAVEAGFFVKPNYIGSLEASGVARAREVARLLTEAGLDTEYTSEIRSHAWEKVILNSSMSPLSALTGLTMKDVMDLPHLRPVVEGVTREGIAVARAEGASFPEAFFERCIEYLGKGGRHKPSMLVDVEAGRPTEIDYLNGRICELGERRGIAVPFNRTITGLVKGLEARLAQRPAEKVAA